MKRDFTKRERNIFIVLMALLVFFYLMQLVIKPLYVENISLDQSINIKLKTLKKELKKIEKSKLIEQKYRAFLSTFSQKKSEEEIMSEFLSSIEVVSRKMNLSISDLKPNKIKKEELVNYFSVSLTINSQLDDVINFLSVMQSSPHFLNVEEIKFERMLQRQKTFVKTRISLSKILFLEGI